MQGTGGGHGDGEGAGDWEVRGGGEGAGHLVQTATQWAILVVGKSNTKGRHGIRHAAANCSLVIRTYPAVPRIAGFQAIVQFGNELSASGKPGRGQSKGAGGSIAERATYLARILSHCHGRE